MTEIATSAGGRPPAPSIVDLAERIEEDIRTRQLQPGDPYLNAAQTAKMLRVGTAAANRALQLLEQRQVLVRSQRKGTFIASPPVESGFTSRRVNLIVDQNFLKTEGVLADGVLVGIQGVLPRAELRFRFLPVTDDPDLVHQMIDEALQSPQREGFVLVRSSLTVQKLVADSGLPAVIHGTPYPSITSIPWIDKDVSEAARLLTAHLLSQGCQRFIVLLRQQVLPGDHPFLDTIQHSLSEAGLSAQLTIRCLPAIDDVVRHEVADLLSAAREPVGIICRSWPLAHGAMEAIKSQGKRKKNRRALIGVSDVYQKTAADRFPWPYTQMMLTPEEIGTKIGTLLLEQFAERPVSGDHFVIPVRLAEPGDEPAAS